MRWPWRRAPENRADFGNALADAFLGAAAGTASSAASTAALEASAGLIGRAFAAANVSGPDEITPALSPACLGMVGRQLIRTGEIGLYITVGRDGLMLRPSSGMDVEGGSDPAGWTYRLYLSGPSMQDTLQRVSADRVLHFRYASDPLAPWQGYGPIQSAKLAGTLSANIVNALGEEADTTRAQMIPVPKDGGSTTLDGLRADLRAAKGRVALVEDPSGGWEAGQSRGQQRAPLAPVRLGANPPATLISLAQQAFAEVSAACGCPIDLFASAQGTASREAYRRWMHSTVTPLGKMVEEELRLKLDPDITLDFESLFAGDVQGRARAFASMVNGGMDVARAAGLSGLLAADDA